MNLPETCSQYGKVLDVFRTGNTIWDSSPSYIASSLTSYRELGEGEFDIFFHEMTQFAYKNDDINYPPTNLGFNFNVYCAHISLKELQALKEEGMIVIVVAAHSNSRTQMFGNLVLFM